MTHSQNIYLALVGLSPSWFTNIGTIASKLCKVSLERFHISMVNHALGETVIDMYIRPDRSIIHRPMASHLHEEAAVDSPIMVPCDCHREGLNQSRMASTYDALVKKAKNANGPAK